MKKRYLFILIIILGIFLKSYGGYATDTYSYNDIDNKRFEKVEKLLNKFENELSKIGLTPEEIKSVGNYYFDNVGNIVLQFSISDKEDIKLEKFEKIASKLYQLYPNEVQI